ncbi:stress responsive protein [Fulvitalea axinellae]|uniref:Stress responsive protein n=1 Tax=Fulvitalea axinellae TaxID=1182444 RepID=A0AAU9CCV0_9BACT|nr:stress responsive protein [Fulvitalea axinellae]
MVKHVVMWRFKDEANGNTKSENIKKTIEILQSLKGKIETLSSLETGENFNPSEAAFDLVLITTHPDKEGLDAYQTHPDHKEAGAFIGSVVSERVVTDFEF